MLQTRAWLIHSVCNIVRIIYWVIGESKWLKSIDSCQDLIEIESGDENCVNIEFKEDLVDEIRPTLTIISLTLLICGSLIDITAFKWRHYADYIIFFEVVIGLLTFTVPSNQSNLTELNISMD